MVVNFLTVFYLELERPSTTSHNYQLFGERTGMTETAR